MLHVCCTCASHLPRATKGISRSYQAQRERVVGDRQRSLQHQTRKAVLPIECGLLPRAHRSHACHLHCPTAPTACSRYRLQPTHISLDGHFRPRCMLACPTNSQDTIAEPPATVVSMKKAINLGVGSAFTFYISIAVTGTAFPFTLIVSQIIHLSSHALLLCQLCT